MVHYRITNTLKYKHLDVFKININIVKNSCKIVSCCPHSLHLCVVITIQ